MFRWCRAVAKQQLNPPRYRSVSGICLLSELHGNARTKQGKIRCSPLRSSSLSVMEIERLHGLILYRLE